MIVYPSGLLMESCPLAGQTPVGNRSNLDVMNDIWLLPTLKIVSRVEGEMLVGER
jgi:hypothetical protein